MPSPDVIIDTSGDRDLARRTGASLEQLQRWRELGLLPVLPTDVPDGRLAVRVRLLQFAHRRGIEAERIAAAVAEQPELLDLFEEHLTGDAGRERSLKEGAAEAGVDLELARTLRHAAGLGDQDILHDEDVEALRAVATTVQSGMPEAALLQLVRVYADALGRVAEAENRLFHLHVHEQFRADGLRGSTLISATREVSTPLLGLVEPAVVYFHHKAWEKAVLEDLLLHLCEDVTSPTEIRGQMVSTVLFTDLASFTPMTMAMGDAAAAQVVDRFCDLVRSCADTCSGRIVKQIGDALMIVFGDPAGAVTCGLDIEAAVADEPQFPAVHVGAHTGALLYREGDYLGHTVNVAARVAAEAGPHQMVVSAALREAAGDMAGVEFVHLGGRRLKGVAEPVELFEARRGDALTARLRDPVCGMEMHPGQEHARLVSEGKQVVFCSAGCLQRFTAQAR